MLDTRERAALQIITEVVGGGAETLSARAEALDALPPVAPVRVMKTVLAAAPRLAAVLPRFGAKPTTS